MTISGNISLVTGASRGIGKQIALDLAKQNVHVGLVGRHETTLVAVKEQIIKSGGNASVFAADLARKQEIKKLISNVTTELGNVDLLVNVASVWHNGERIYQGPHLENIGTEEIDEVLDVGLKAPIFLSQLVLPNMISKRYGKILQISGAFAGEADATGWLHYYVAKKGLEDFTRGLAEEVRPFEIQVNCISPWFVATEPAIKFYPKKVIKTALSPEAVSRFAIYLLSDEAKHITGSVTVLRDSRDH
jgi:NAD(P)-dependent dehydrogenase (short-subunit alcohol dehydrogenase family)